MYNHKIKGIIFDLGNVLLDFNHMIAAEKLSGFTDKKGKEIYDLFFDSQKTQLFEEGKISASEFFKGVKEMLNLKIPYEEFVPIWNGIFYLTDQNLQVYNLARSLKNGYRLALLSNINFLHLEHIKKTFPILDVFHNVLASCELGLRKPQPEIYQKALEILGTQAQETFYTDDRTELIRGAKKLGINAAVFFGVDQLKKDFIAAGVNIN
ncbi:MAG: HAD family phosphatase [Candidatus Omnitrophota bacterium]